MGFVKGKVKTGGRQLGQPNKVTLDIKGYARAVIEDPDYQTKLKQRLLDGSAPQLEVLLHYYAYGKPKLEIGMDNTITVTVSRMGYAADVQPALEDHSQEEGYSNGEAIFSSRTS
jgi:hypothetical protein